MAVTSIAESALLRIETVLRAITVAGGYNYDLDDEGQVLIGEGLPAGARKPMVVLTMANVTTVDGAPLGWFRRQLTVGVLGCVPSTSKPRTKVLAAIRLADDVTRAIDADRSLNNTVLDVKADLDAVAGDEFGLAGMAVVNGTISAYWEVEAGL